MSRQKKKAKINESFESKLIKSFIERPAIRQFIKIIDYENNGSEFLQFCYSLGKFSKRYERKPDQLRSFLEKKCHLKENLDNPLAFYFFDQDEFWPVLAEFGLFPTNQYDPETRMNLIGYIVSYDKDPINCWRRLYKLVVEYKCDPTKPMQDEKNPELFYYRHWSKVIVSVSSNESPVLDLLDKFRLDFGMNLVDIRPFLKHFIDGSFYLSVVFPK